MIRRQLLALLEAVVTCLARRWKSLSFPLGLPCWVRCLSIPQPFVVVSQLCKVKEEKRSAIKIKCRKRTGKRLRSIERFDSIWELWRLSNQFRHGAFLYSHVKSIDRERGSKSPFYFYSLVVSIKRFFCTLHSIQSPITMYQIDIMGRLTFAGDFLTSSRLRQSSNHLRREETILQLRRTWIIASPTRINCTIVFRTKSGRNRFIVYLHSAPATVNLSRLPFRLSSRAR